MCIVVTLLSLAIRQDEASVDASNDRDEMKMRPVTNNRVPEIYLVKADVLEMVSDLTAFTPDSDNNQDFPCWFCGFGPVGLVVLDVLMCP